MTRLILAVALAAPVLFAQNIDDKSTDRKTHSGVNDLVIDNVSGDIEVTAGTGGDVQVEVTRTFSAWSQERIAIAQREVKLNVTQEGGLLRYFVDGPFRCHSNGSGGCVNFDGHQLYSFRYDFKICVPRAIKLELYAVNKGHVKVEGTSGDFKINNVNGGIEMYDIEGQGSIHTVNGPVKVTFARNPTGPVSFKSVNGTIEASFRSGLNANLLLKTFNGGLYTDFDVSTMPVSQQPEHINGRYVWRKHGETAVKAGAGGPELSFDTLNGNVLIKNREK
jgi:hypothetical protein